MFRGSNEKIFTFCLAGVVIFTISLSAQAGWDPTKEERKISDVEETILAFKRHDLALEKFFKEAYGYAVFPTVGKAGIGIGGAYGTGLVYEKGNLIGSTTLKQVSYGLQLGGQAYREVIFFKDQAALEDFTRGNFEFGATASAVALTAGASADADYDNGVAVFTIAKGGLMYEATIAGQKFTFRPEQD